jgi:hypothetical protein
VSPQGSKSSKAGTAPTGQDVPGGPSAAHGFDLNIQKVLEHWPIAFALREFIANALDEAALTESGTPEIFEDADGVCRIRDFGRGVRYEHLTQKENPEKIKHPGVIGQFGIGLKDALAVCDRRKVHVLIRSAHGDVTTAQLPKSGFSDVVTLHGVVAPPSDPAMVGTEVIVSGVSAKDVETAKSFFLRFSGDVLLESTSYGEVLARPNDKAPGRIYVKGLLVAEEPNFLFSYNITKINAALRRALNRERTNVGRGAYSDRVKEILKECRTADVAGPLSADLAQFVSGKMHDELGWKDVALHGCRVLQCIEKVIFVAIFQIRLPAVVHAVEEGYRMVIVPDDIARALGSMTDLEGRPMFDLTAFQQEWNESFVYDFVATEDLSEAEQAIYALTAPAAKLAGVNLAKLKLSVAISETTRLSLGPNEVVGVWERAEKRIVIRRDQLASAQRYCGTFLHELTHAMTDLPDLCLEFEEALTVKMGTVAATGLAPTLGATKAPKPALAKKS